MQRVRLVLPLLLIVAGCGGHQPDVIGAENGGARHAPSAEPPPAVARGCPPAARQGPWTACAEAEWVSRVAEAAGNRIVDETGSALVAEGGGDSFYIWTTRHAILPPIEKIREDEGWKELGKASGVTIYGDERLWRWWSTDDTIFWIKAGPYETSTVPDVGELERLVAASLRLQPPNGRRHDKKGARQEGSKIIALNGLALSVPGGWDSESFTNPSGMSVFRVGSFAFPDRSDDDVGQIARAAMGPADVLINIVDYTAVDPREDPPYTAVTPPLAVDSSEAVQQEGYTVPAAVVRSVLIHDHKLYLSVAFGRSPPSRAQVSAANAVLRTLSAS